MATRQRKVEKLIDHIDQEANVTTRQLQSIKQESNHQEVMHLLKTRLPHTPDLAMFANKLPYDNLPGQPNQSFFGREAELEQLTTFMRPGNQLEQQFCACLHGLAGSGKTQLALKYAYQHFPSDYDAVLWIAGDTPLKLASSFSTVAHELGLADESVRNSKHLAGLVKRWLLAAGKKGMY